MAEYIRGDVISADNRTIEFGKETSKNCPSCNPSGGRDNRNLYIRTNIGNSVTLECKTCGYTENKPVSEVQEALEGMVGLNGKPIKVSK